MCQMEIGVILSALNLCYLFHVKITDLHMNNQQSLVSSKEIVGRF